MKWWLISDKDVSIIREGLQAPTHGANDYNCQDWPIGAGCSACQGHDLRRVALMALDTGLNKTEEIPGDFRFCPECGEFKPDDDRVRNGMRCGECAYYPQPVSLTDADE